MTGRPVFDYRGGTWKRFVAPQKLRITMLGPGADFPEKELRMLGWVQLIPPANAPFKPLNLIGIWIKVALSGRIVTTMSSQAWHP